MKPVIVCTDKRGVIFGYAEKDRPNERGQITLEKARMCLYWPSTVGGVFGLGDIGPNADTKVSASLSKVRLEGVTAIFDVSPAAETAWKSAPIQGRE
tara:strand:+ start:404 stop:694 length:291 start_codon:yes stop_codon:yes gene_type:complete